MSGARNLRRVIVEQVEDPLSELILRGKAGNEVRLSVRCGKMIINNSCEALAPRLKREKGFLSDAESQFFFCYSV